MFKYIYLYPVCHIIHFCVYFNNDLAFFPVALVFYWWRVHITYYQLHLR